jgi:glutamate synthase (NADPH/NADH) small chain
MRDRLMAKKIGQKEKTPMPCLDPADRRSSFAEVAEGYTLAMAVQEASRCIECKNRPCIAGCPVEIDIPAFVAQLAKSDVAGAFQTLSDKNVLPAICGRVCPQEEQCEAKCTIGVRFEPVSIGRLERFVADYAAAQGFQPARAKAASSGKRVAIIGRTRGADRGQRSRAVRACRHDFRGAPQAGRCVDLRIPNSGCRNRSSSVDRAGINRREIRTNHVIGRTYTVDELLTELGYDAVFIATGAGLPHFPKIPGINLIGVYSANEYLTRANLMKAYLFPRFDTPAIRGREVAVIGGGNTAMDAVRMALRLGAARAYLVYRRSRDEMPARREELEHAEEEGVELVLLTAPIAVLDDGQSRVNALRCQRMALGEPDVSGRRSRCRSGDEFDIRVDTVVFRRAGCQSAHQSGTDLPFTRRSSSPTEQRHAQVRRVRRIS